MRFNAIIPELLVSEYARSKNFYIGVLGFTLEYERANGNFAFLSFEESQIMLFQANGTWAETGVLEYPLGRGVILIKYAYRGRSKLFRER
jgi:catechol 2,3-dioxygenase-like lactoylglutathione lyase family enzyme